LWKSAGRPSSGALYDNYKHTRKCYKTLCRQAIKQQEVKLYSELDKLCMSKRSKRLWNRIKKTKQAGSQDDCVSHINLPTLEDYFRTKFSKPDKQTEYIHEASVQVANRHNQIKSSNDNKVYVSEHRVRKYIQKLNSGCSAGLDGIVSEHIKHANNDMLVLHLCVLLSLCVIAGVVPDSFCHGLIVPIIKKNNIDPTQPNNDRPITISSVLSKLLELYILDHCENYELTKCQYGFIKGRNTSMAATVVHDISSYCVSKGSCVFMCSLDAEGAFDAIPIAVLLYKAMDVIPDHCWNILYYWYYNMSVQIGWANLVGKSIPVERGTRQGGLSSPLLFNLFYEELVSNLNSAECGVTIGEHHFNVSCYADDLLLCSLTVSGLQKLINYADEYISGHGLRFNPSKTICMVYGKHWLTSDPKWTIKNEQLTNRDSITYLGTVLDGSHIKTGTKHTDSRIRAAQRAFYGLQGAGLHSNGVSPQTVLHIYEAAVRSVILYGCTSVHINKSNLAKLDRLQARFIKCALGLNPRRCRTTALLQATKTLPISQTIDIQCLELLRSCLFGSSSAQQFYTHILSENDCHMQRTLLERVSSFCNQTNIDLMKYVFNDTYRNSKKCILQEHLPGGQNGLIDSIRYILNNYSYNNKKLLSIMLNAF
jgi:hypothetical protein